MRLTLADLPEDLRRQAEKQLAGRPCPVSPAGIPPGNRPAGSAEKDLQRGAEAWLRVMGCIVFHMPGKAAIGNMVGFPDIVAFCHGGRVLLIELKSPRGKLSDGQERMFPEFDARGHRVHVCRSIDDVQDAYFSTMPEQAFVPEGRG